jgi:hypothetical protein
MSSRNGSHPAHKADAHVGAQHHHPPPNARAARCAKRTTSAGPKGLYPLKRNGGTPAFTTVVTPKSTASGGEAS